MLINADADFNWGAKMIWWAFAAVATVLILRTLWKAYTHPAHVLGRQAANMHWVVAGASKDEHGYRNMRVTRDGMTAVISFKTENINLINPPCPAPFKDFVDLEHWIAALPPNTATIPKELNYQMLDALMAEEPIGIDEINEPVDEYIEKIDDYIMTRPEYEGVLLTETADMEFMCRCYELKTLGFECAQYPEVVGALIIKVWKDYNRNKNLGHRLFDSVEQSFNKDRDKSET